MALLSRASSVEAKTKARAKSKSKSKSQTKTRAQSKSKSQTKTRTKSKSKRKGQDREQEQDQDKDQEQDQDQGPRQEPPRSQCKEKTLPCLNQTGEGSSLHLNLGCSAFRCATRPPLFVWGSGGRAFFRE